ncbi:hypothetical protein DIPPA_10301 [Diplonema papillatum]|nr:hypothetical protein DIPPA_10301 [Diplonema papillatum]
MNNPSKWFALALLGQLMHSSDAAIVRMLGHDDVGISSFISEGMWDNAAPPSAGNDYFTGPYRLRSPATTLNYTFAGDSLTVNTNEGRLFGKSIADPISPGQVLTINNLILDGGYVDQSGWSWLTLMGHITVISESSFGASSSDTLEIMAPISGSAPLNISGPYINSGGDTGSVILSAANPAYTGTMTLCANTPANSGNGLLRLNHRDALAEATLNTISSTIVAQSFSRAANTGPFNIGALTGTGNMMLSDSVGMPVVLSIGGKGSSTTYSGSLVGSGGLIKVGSGTLTIRGASTSYRGNTTVEAGTLTLAVSYLYDESTVSIADGAVLQLDFAGTDTVGALVLAGNAQPDGVYTSGNSSGFISGPGSLLVKTLVAASDIPATQAPPVDSPYRSTRTWRAYDGGSAPPSSSFFDVPFMAVSTTDSAEALRIAGSGETAVIYHSADDAAVVGIAAKALRDDVERVTDLIPTVSTGVPAAAAAILIGTIGASPLIDGLITAGKLDVTAIEGKWEAYMAVVVENPMADVDRALIIVGSDRRGTAFGVFGLSESMGVSPWYWWGDVAVEHKAALFISGSHTQLSPAVKYRGIFLNDEDWGLQPWAAQKFEPEVGNIGPKTYGTIYELLLRLHSNMIWPAMHEWPVMTTPFYLVPGNKEMADEYAIVISTSHHEPMLRNSHEYDENIVGAYSYWSNWDNIYRFWDERVEETAHFENIYTIGMRGRTDAGMSAPSGTTDAQKAQMLQNTIIPDQREMLSTHVNTDASQMPQIFIPYKETLVQYQAGLQLPDDVTILWPDDNHGYIRQLSSASERARSGGAGVYYHLSYWGTPASYLWFCSTPPGMTRYEMLKAWDFEARNIWIVNVGDLKPMEIGMDFFLRMARNPEAFRSFNQDDYFTQWATRTFNSHAESIAEVLGEYFSLNIAKRPEHIASEETSGFSLVSDGDEAQKRLDKFASLVTLADSIYGELSAEQKPSFYEMVLYPVRASYHANQRTLLAERSRLWAEQKRAATATLAAEAHAAREAVMADVQFYNEVNTGGKWNMMLNPAPETDGWSRETQNPFLVPEVGSYTPPAAAALGVAIEGSAAVLKSDVRSELSIFNRAANSSRFIDVFNQGSDAMSWTAEADAPWVVLSETSGTADARIMVSINWDTAPRGNAVLGSVTVAGAGAEHTVSLVVYNPENLDLANLPDAVEDNYAVVIEAEDFAARVDGGDGTGWRRVDKATASQDGMAIEPVTASSLDPTSLPTDAPSLTYNFYAFSTGPVQILTQCLPTHRTTSDHVGVRYVISLNGDNPIVVDVNAEEYTTAWNVNTLRAASVGVSDHKITASGLQTIKVWMVDASVVLDKLTVQLFSGTYMYEVEDLTVHNTSIDTPVVTYTDVPASGGAGVHIQATKASQFGTLILPNVEAGDYEIIISVKKWTSRGIMQLAVAETATGRFMDIGDEQDLYSTTGGYSNLEAIPVKFFSSGPKYLRFMTTGKNPSASGYWILFDTISLTTVTVVTPSGPYVNEIEGLAVHDANTAVVTYADLPASGGSGLDIQATDVSQYAVLMLPNVKTGPYQLTVRVKKSTNLGIMQMAVAEAPTGPYRNIGDEHDLYSASALYTNLEVVTVSFSSDGPKFLRFMVTGKSPSSTGYSILLDTVDLSAPTMSAGSIADLDCFRVLAVLALAQCLFW